MREKRKATARGDSQSQISTATMMKSSFVRVEFLIYQTSSSSELKSEAGQTSRYLQPRIPMLSRAFM